VPFDFAADFADVAFEAVDVASEIAESGAEFLNEIGDLGDVLGEFDQFDALSNFDYEQVGSFAGDGGWWDANFPGDIVSNSSTLTDIDFTAGGAFTEVNGVFVSTADLQAQSFDNFFTGAKEAFGIPTELGGSFGGDILAKAQSLVPSFDQLAAQAQKAITQQIVNTAIQTTARAISSQTAGIPIVGGALTNVVNRTAGAVNASINQQVAGRPVTIPSLSQLTGINPNIGIPNVPGIQLASLGNNIPLSFVKPGPGTVTVTGPNGQPLNIQTPGFNPSVQQSVFTNYTAGEDPETGQWAVFGQDGLPLPGYTNLTPELAQQIANEARVNATSNIPPANTAPSASQIDTSAGPVGYITAFDPETGTYAVVNQDTGLPVATGLTEQQAQLQAQEQGFFDEGIPVPLSQEQQGPPLALAGNLTPEQLNQIAAEAGVDAGDVGQGGITDAQLFAEESAITDALREQARQQQTIRNQRQNRAQTGDWRVRLSLAPNSNYLYNDPDCGPVLWPLFLTDGVIFPYTPAIDIGYKANYSAYDLTHSNYKGYFYQNSAIDQINVRATFTAQDTNEANYLLAVIHFFRSATKMFYGQDAERGSPPPLCYLSGFGDFQFSRHPVVINQFNYNLPADVNYIRAQTTTDVGTNLQPTARARQSIAGNPLSYALKRLETLGQGIKKGALNSTFAPSGSLGLGNPTYVPTKIEISLTLLPMQSRQQVSKQFSLKGFANGNLLKGGFW
jgi:hypothetical protein